MKTQQTKYNGTKYERVAALSPASFRRITGVKPTVFAMMMQVLRRAEKKTRKRGGKPPDLCLEDRLLLCLEYLREYRTFAHIAIAYGVSESTAHRTSRWVEDTLIKDKRFALPGRKALTRSDVEFEVVLIDVSESPVERPKKDRNATTLARKSVIHLKPK